MNSGLPGDIGPTSDPKSIQEYIDETPVWRDGTVLRTTPMTGMQWRIWTLAAAGKFFKGLLVFMTGVAMPLIADEFQLNPAQHGVVGAASLFGILVGAVGFGSLSDHFGRKRMFVRHSELPVSDQLKQCEAVAHQSLFTFPGAIALIWGNSLRFD